MAIDEKKLIDQLKVWMKLLNKKSGADNTRYELLDEVIDLIEEQPKLSLETKTSDWIPCSERVPKQNEYIIGTFKNINEGSNLVFGVNFYHDLLNEPMPLIAWMPLPESYRGKNEKYY